MNQPNNSTNKLRPITITPDYAGYADACVLIQQGNTWVLCNATLKQQTARFLRGTGKGWVTAEYAMLPTATNNRNKRETQGAKGRTLEIQRLIGRSLRAGVKLDKLGEVSIRIDCDVLQADGGTRTAAISASWVALRRLLYKHFNSQIDAILKHQHITAVSVGIVNRLPVLDLNYKQDSNADSDINIVVADDNQIVEIQGTAEKVTFTRAELNTLIDKAESGIQTIQAIQQKHYQ